MRQSQEPELATSTHHLNRTIKTTRPTPPHHLGSTASLWLCCAASNKGTIDTESRCSESRPVSDQESGAGMQLPHAHCQLVDSTHTESHIFPAYNAAQQKTASRECCFVAQRERDFPERQQWLKGTLVGSGHRTWANAIGSDEIRKMLRYRPTQPTETIYRAFSTPPHHCGS